MLCGEYAVLDGATALALPTIKGQQMEVEVSQTLLNEGILIWQAYDVNDAIWFSAKISLPHLIIEDTTDNNVALQLIRFLITARAINPDFLNESHIYHISTYLEFDTEEGLGSSSTLTANIAQWAGIDPFVLHFNAFKGSGFDIAVAITGQPLLYQVNHRIPTIEAFIWDKPFNDQLFFIHLNQKQNSRTEISRYNNIHFSQQQIEELTRLSKLLAHTHDYFEFCLLLELAETEVSAALNRPTIKQELFSDFHGTIKSLGAWGGDYILATGDNTPAYFQSKGYDKIVPFNNMIKLSTDT